MWKNNGPSSIEPATIPTGVILTAGSGSRLSPLNKARPKALMPLCNQPLINFQIDALIRLGVQRIIIQVGIQNSRIVKQYIYSRYRNQKVDDVVIDFLYDPSPSDFSMRLLHKEINTHFALLDCDRMAHLPVHCMKEFHFSNDATATWALAPAIGNAVASWHCDSQGKIIKYRKKGVTGSYEHAGLILASPTFFEQMISPSDMIPFDFYGSEPWYGYQPQSAEFWSNAPEFNISPLANWYGFISDIYAIDVGTPSRYFRAHFDALLGRSRFISRNAHKLREPNGWVHFDAEIAREVKFVAPYLVGSRARIEPGSTIGPFGVVGNNSVIRSGSLITNSIIWDNVEVGGDVEVVSSIIADNLVVNSTLKNSLLVIKNHSLIVRDITKEIGSVWSG